MATSGQSIQPITRDQICIKALKKCGQLAEGDPVIEEQITDAADDLNRMIKGWQADGVKIWTMQEQRLFLNPGSTGQTLYNLGPGAGGANLVPISGLISTRSTSTLAIGGLTITLASVVGVVSGMNIGILCDDNSLWWTTVNGAPAGNVVTLTAGPIVSATNSSNVWIYQTGADRPLRIEGARIQTSPTSEIMMRPLSRADYMNLPNKTAVGEPTQFHYSPMLNQGAFYPWALPYDSTLYINITAYRPLQIFVNPNDNFDGPDEDQQGLIWALASEICSEYGVDKDTMARIDTKAQNWIKSMEAFDVEEASVIFVPDLG
jgi:hypothetical protein